MFYQGKNVLVLQAGKMFGRSLAALLLEQGAIVRATYERAHPIDFSHKHLQAVECDLSRPEEAAGAFRDIEIVFLTANVSAGAKVIKERPESLFMENIRLQPRLMELAVRSGAARVGFMSSSYIYPDTGRPNVEGEGFAGDPAPVSFGIGWCFRYLETLCKHFQMVSKTRFAILRPAAYYGPYDNFDPENAFVIPSLILKALRRANPFEVWGNGEDVRSFTYVDDLMQGFMLAVEKYPEAEGINICAGQGYKIKEVVSHLLEILDYRPEVRYSTGKPSVAPYKVSDPSEARKRLGWQARTGLREGLKKTIDWYRMRAA